YPVETQMLHIPVGDRGEWTVAPGLIVAPDHQSVAGVGMAQHLIGHRCKILHYSRYRQPLWRVHSRLVCRPLANRHADKPRHLTRGHRANHRAGCWGERLISRTAAVGFEKE